MWLGVDYYPEQWDLSLMNKDMDNILELGSNVIRIGEFSWHMMEKKEGEFDFSFFDNVIKMAKQKGLSVIMGTPTATIPVWLAKKHSSILSEFANGQKRTFGGRHIYCFNSSVMYDYSKKIIEALINHYKDEKTIVAWQIDNEFGHEGSDVCYCKQCESAFQQFLKTKFNNDIDLLNNTFGTTFWSQEYNDFNEIPTPTATITTHNPSLRLEWERFRSESIVKFADFQVDIIKGILPSSVVIHDFAGGGLDKHCDYSEVAKKLDVVAYNNYPVWGGQKEPIKPYQIAFSLDYIRGLKNQTFWITEAIMGAQGHDITGFLPRPNQAKLWSYQGMARGCTSMIYFRYRGAIKGAEQFCYGVIDSDNKKRRKFFEVKEFFNEISKYKNDLELEIESKVAIVYDYDSLASIRIQKQSVLLEPQKEMEAFYKPFYDNNITVDVIPYTMDFKKYSVLILPILTINKMETEEKIKAFVENGGTVIFTYRCAVKDENNNLILGKSLPIRYNKLTGVTVEEIESLQDFNAFPLMGKDEKGYGGVFRDMLIPSTAEVLYNYGDKFYKEYAAITKNKFGKGTAYYIGCRPDESILEKIVSKIIDETNLIKISSPEGVEIITRGKIQMIMNHNDYSIEWREKKLEAFECKIINK